MSTTLSPLAHSTCSVQGHTTPDTIAIHVIVVLQHAVVYIPGKLLRIPSHLYILSYSVFVKDDANVFTFIYWLNYNNVFM